MKRALVGLALLGACLAPGTVSAQEAGAKGVTMGFPASVGVIWHASDKLAVRPDFSFSHSSTDTPLGETSGNTFGLGVSVLFYTRKWDNAAMYFAPRVAWSRATRESRADLDGFPGVIPIFVDTETESSSDLYSYSGSFGAQAWVGRRFSVFGEVGLAYSTSSEEADSILSTGDVSLKSFNIRSGVGVVLYF